MRRLLALGLMLVLTACAGYQLVEPKRVTVNDTLSVEPGMNWNRLYSETLPRTLAVWTADGQLLNELVFFVGVGENEPLFPPAGSPTATQPGAQPAATEPMPVFRTAMSANEIAELFEASLVRSTKSSLASIKNLRPAEFGGVPGFRFDIDYVTRDDVERSGSVAGAVRNGKLFLIFFQGTRIYHYGRYKSEADRIVASARFL